MPFAPAASHEDAEDVFACPLYRMLPEKLQEESRDKPFLWEYLHTLPVEQFGIPQYHETLNRGMGDLENPNLIYPVGGDCSFTSTRLPWTPATITSP